MPAIWLSQVTFFQLALAIAAVALAIAWPRATSFRGVADRVRKLSSHYLTCGLIAAFLPLAIRFALLPVIPIPDPAIQEEFSNLLEADTFAHGRMSNPPHPMSVFFDNVMMIQYPKYVSLRPPGTAMFLWAGEAVFHRSWFGVCIAVAAMCAAFYWMLLGWTRPVWAFICAILFGLRFGVFTYWMNSYWPGSTAALGGALVLGATPRLARRPAISTAVAFAAGCIILVLNRPLEGLPLIVLAGIAITIAWVRARQAIGLRDVIVKAVAPVAAIGSAALLWLLWYNKATTGCPNIFAYSVSRNGQAIVPNFWWEPLRRVNLVYYSRQTWQFHHVFERSLYEELHVAWRERAIALFWRIMQFPRIDIGLFLLVPLAFPPLARTSRCRHSWLACYFGALLAASAGLVLTAPLALSATLPNVYPYAKYALPLFLVFSIYALALVIRFGKGRLILPLAILLLGLALRLATTFSMPGYYPQYMAPVMILVAEGFRRLHAWSRRRRVGAAIARNICLASLAMAAVQAAIPVTGHHVAGEDPFYMTSYENRLEARVKVERFLESQPGPQLAIVRYSPAHDVLFEWVWNKANIDQQKVVWAREQKPEWTSHLLHYYSSRKAWLVEPDVKPPRVTPYPALAPPDAADPLPEARYVNTPAPPACR